MKFTTAPLRPEDEPTVAEIGTEDDDLNIYLSKGGRRIRVGWLSASDGKFWRGYVSAADQQHFGLTAEGEYLSVAN